MIDNNFSNYNIILASGSPRRQQFFKDLDLDFEIRLKPVKEEYPSRLRHFEISDYLAQLKALPFKDELEEKDILITISHFQINKSINVSGFIFLRDESL